MKKFCPFLSVMFLTACSTHQSIENSATASIQDKDAALAEDPFLWLEEVESGEALEWAKEQNSKTVERLQGDSRYQELYDDLLEVYEDPDKITRVTERGDFLYNFWRDAEHVQGIYRRTTLDSYRTGTPEWETIIDLDALSKEEGKTWVYRGISCLAPDYELCMLRLSDGGSDAIYSREFNLHTGEFVKDDAFLVPESKHRTTWIDEDTLMLGYDYGPDSVTESGYPRTVRLWKRGQSLEEATLVFEGEKQDVSAGAWRPDYPEVDYTLFFRSLDFYNQDYYVQFDGDEELRKIPFPTSLDVVGAFQHYLIYTNRKDWKPDPLWGIDRTLKQGSLFAFDLRSVQAGDYSKSLSLIWEPSENVFLTGTYPTKNYLLLSLMDKVKGKAQRASLKNGKWILEALPLPENGRIDFGSASFENDRVFAYFRSFLQPETQYYFDVSTLELTALRSQKEYFDAGGLKTEQYEATSRDGTKVPYFIVRPANMDFDGSHPVEISAYGGFEISLRPFYSGGIGRSWLDRGGIFVLANLRGGGEFGPEWHQAGLKGKRQNIYDDLHAVAEDLIARKVTRPGKIGISGGSNGGLLVGAAFTQRPDLYGAVYCSVPLLDMLRYHKLLAGASWMGEYGNPDNPEEREFLLEYSPYHNVSRDRTYPEVFFYTSTKDDRVHPAHARKMVARMMEQGHPVLYYENLEGGHGGAANLKQSARQQAMKYVYFMQKLMD